MSGILLLSVFPSVQGLSGSTFFMKTNSTAKIYANFTFNTPSNETVNLSPQISSSLYRPNVSTPGEPSISVVSNSFTANKNNIGVTYTITAKGHARGVYSLSLYLCDFSPLVVGLNESEINPVLFSEFFNATYYGSCAPKIPSSMKIEGYSDIISKIIQINGSLTNNAYSVNQLGTLPESPLKQFANGVKLSDIECRKGFLLITKHENGLPACVTANGAIILAERGWTNDVKIHNPSD